jgi:hypothetical protein
MIMIIIIITLLSRVLPEKLSGSQLVKKFPAFNGTHRFIIPFTSAATCPYPEPDQSISCPPSHFLKIYITVVLLSLPLSSKRSFFLRSPQQNPVCTSPIFHTCHKSRPGGSFFFFCHRNNICSVVQIWFIIVIIILLSMDSVVRTLLYISMSVCTCIYTYIPFACFIPSWSFSLSFLFYADTADPDIQENYIQ